MSIESELTKATQDGNLEFLENFVNNPLTAIPIKTLVTGDTLFHIAAQKGHDELLQWMLRQIVDNEIIKNVVNAINNNGLTPLYFAVLNGHINTMLVLLGHNADINFKTNYMGNTIIHIAARIGKPAHLDIIKYLMENREHFNLDINLRNQLGETALDCAKRRNNQEIVEYLEPFYQT
jgi:ankyrin repeat protein